MKFKKLHENAYLPERAHSSDAGVDLRALTDVVVPSIFKTFFYFLVDRFQAFVYNDTIKNISVTKIPTGIAVILPENTFGLIADKSGLGSKLLKVFGGVVDQGYTGDLTVQLVNYSFLDYQVKAGDKIANLVVIPIICEQSEEVTDLPSTERGENGFGSSGR